MTITRLTKATIRKIIEHTDIDAIMEYPAEVLPHTNGNRYRVTRRGVDMGGATTDDILALMYQQAPGHMTDREHTYAATIPTIRRVR